MKTIKRIERRQCKHLRLEDMIIKTTTSFKQTVGTTIYRLHQSYKTYKEDRRRRKNEKIGVKRTREFVMKYGTAIECEQRKPSDMKGKGHTQINTAENGGKSTRVFKKTSRT